MLSEEKKLIRYLTGQGAFFLMKFRAMIKKSGDWWIGWLIDLPGVNAQEKTKEKLLDSLKIGAEDLLKTEVPFEAGAQMTTIEIPPPEWSLENTR